MIAIDPGHGGKDPGAIGYEPWQLREADVAWSVSAVVRALLGQGAAEVAGDKLLDEIAKLGLLKVVKVEKAYALD